MVNLLRFLVNILNVLSLISKRRRKKSMENAQYFVKDKTRKSYTLCLICFVYLHVYNMNNTQNTFELKIV